MFSPYQLLSDFKNYPPEGAALSEITESISRFSQRECFSNNRFDRAGLKKRVTKMFRREAGLAVTCRAHCPLVEGKLPRLLRARMEPHSGAARLHV